jgi:hypothetical protein
MEIVTVAAEFPEAGHRIHAERPDDFLTTITPSLA